MGKIAVNVVLLPSEDMMDHLIRANRDLIDKTGDGSIVLHKQKCVPHISLCMGILDDEKLDSVNKILKEISENQEPFSFNANTYLSNIIPNGKQWIGLNFEYSHRFRDLQQNVMKNLRDKITFKDASLDMLVDSNLADDNSTLFRIEDYGKKDGNPDLYNPYIALGFGKTDILELPLRFSSSKIAIFQIGNYCTCRKLLGIYELIGE